VEFTTADLSDAHLDSVQVLEPLFHEFGGLSRFWGPIATVRVFEDNGLVRAILETRGSGQVLVVDGGGSRQCALVGGRLATLAHANGWAGLLIHGSVRDSMELSGVPLGLRALGATPVRSHKAGAGEQGVTLSFAGVAFVPGHFLYADSDGVLLAPRNLLSSVDNP
jgi:regulator of ribonuclease activity A